MVSWRPFSAKILLRIMKPSWVNPFAFTAEAEYLDTACLMFSRSSSPRDLPKHFVWKS